MLETLFNNITGEFMVTQLNYLALYALDNFVFVLLALSMLQNMLDNIIPKLIFYERMEFPKDLIDYWSCLFLCAILQDSLDYSTSICMYTKLTSILSNLLNNKINGIRRHFLNTFLDNMITILVINALNNRVL